MGKEYISENTYRFLRETPEDYRKKNGQFFTTNELVLKTLSYLNINNNSEILEPSFGTGEFLFELEKLSDNITAVEKDEALFKSLNTTKEINIICDDFLLHDFNSQKFDFIIGNPPYFETPLYNDKFEEVIKGRTNVYSLFIKKSIDLLKDNGIIAFIVPTTINTGAYFSGIRNYIVKYCSIINIENLGIFPTAQQNTQIIILKKETNDKNFVVEKDSGVIFSDKYEKLNSILKDSKSIKDLGFTVETGSVVWNQSVDKICDKEKTLLVWNQNIQNEFTPLSQKQYIEATPKYDYGIVFKRIFNKNKNNFLFLEEPFLAENHVNVIYSDNKEKLKKLYDLLKSIDISYFFLFTDSTQISKTELEEMPIWGNNFL